MFVSAALVASLGAGLAFGHPTASGAGGSRYQQPGAAIAGRAAAAPAARAADVWQPAVGTPWQIVLLGGGIKIQDGAVTPDVPVFDLDLFSNTNDGTDADSVIGALHGLGKKVICYFSAGTYEPDRPDSAQYADADKGAGLPEWPDEIWVDIRRDSVRNIISNRIEVAAKMGCDGIDPDNMDGFANENGGGFNPPLVKQDSIDLIKLMAKQAAGHGMAIGLKNAVGILPDVQDVVQFAVNEECADYKDCSSSQALINLGKPVFHIEYPDGAGDDAGVAASARDKYCAAKGADGFSTVLKTDDLDGWVEYCDGTVAKTPRRS